MQRLNIPNELDHKYATTNWILVSIIFITVGINDKRLPTIAKSISNLALEYAVFPVFIARSGRKFRYAHNLQM